jgi:hypothetical protein
MWGSGWCVGVQLRVLVLGSRGNLIVLGVLGSKGNLLVFGFVYGKCSRLLMGGRGAKSDSGSRWVLD